jgi:hypothetical protein
MRPAAFDWQLAVDNCFGVGCTSVDEAWRQATESEKGRCSEPGRPPPLGRIVAWESSLEAVRRVGRSVEGPVLLGQAQAQGYGHGQEQDAWPAACIELAGWTCAGGRRPSGCPGSGCCTCWDRMAVVQGSWARVRCNSRVPVVAVADGAAFQMSLRTLSGYGRGPWKEARETTMSLFETGREGVPPRICWRRRHLAAGSCYCRGSLEGAEAVDDRSGSRPWCGCCAAGQRFRVGPCRQTV